MSYYKGLLQCAGFSFLECFRNGKSVIPVLEKLTRGHYVTISQKEWNRDELRSCRLLRNIWMWSKGRT